MRIRCSLPLALFLPVVVLAQSQPEVQQILERLQRLEEQNQKLMSEIHALRQELAASGIRRAESTPAEAQPAAGLEERVAIAEQRIEEQAQTKVESEHKLPIKLTGILLFNAFANGRNSGSQYPTTAALLPAGQRGAAADGATIRQSILGLQFQGPEIFGGGKVSGSLYMDFFGGTGAALNQLGRLRVASLDMAWEKNTFSVGPGSAVPARVASFDGVVRPAATRDVSGQLFGGQNVGVLGGLRQGLAFLPNERIHAVTAAGGWAQLTIRATRRLSFNMFGGQEDDWNSDLAFGGISKNQTYAGNVMYRLGFKVIMRFESSHTRTLYIGAGLRLNPHYDLAIANLY